MSQEPYTKEHLDEIHRNQSEKLENIHNDIIEVKKEVQYTNGKVRKIILALVTLSAFTAGLGLKEFEVVLTFLGL